MTTLEFAKQKNQINDEELLEITQIMFNSFKINRNYKDLTYVSKKETLISLFSSFIEQYLKMNFTGSKENKLRLIKFVSKLNSQKELLELASGEISLDDIQKAGKRLGKKSQSAFGDK
ncbi:MAG: hypothetical protein ACO1NS_02505 [Daejeonella sp.]